MTGRPQPSERENEIERGARWLPLIDHGTDDARSPVPIRPPTGRGRTDGGKLVGLLLGLAQFGPRFT